MAVDTPSYKSHDNGKVLPTNFTHCLAIKVTTMAKFYSRQVQAVDAPRLRAYSAQVEFLCLGCWAPFVALCTLNFVQYAVIWIFVCGWSHGWSLVLLCSSGWELANSDRKHVAIGVASLHSTARGLKTRARGDRPLFHGPL